MVFGHEGYPANGHIDVDITEIGLHRTEPINE
jgi:hypothetical protein